MRSKERFVVYRLHPDIFHPKADAPDGGTFGFGLLSAWSFRRRSG